MDEKRRNEIAYRLEKIRIRKEYSFKDIADAKRRVGNLAKEPEIVAAGITKEELFEYGKLLVKEVFEELMAGL